MTALPDWTTRTNDITKLLLALGQREDVISLAGGLPAAELFPVDAIAEAYARVLKDDPGAALQYGPAEGLRPLREWVAARLRRDGAAVEPENILITTGSQQALAMIGQALLRPGDTIAVDGPVYLAALDAWRPYDPTYAAIRWGNSGESVDLPGPGDLPGNGGDRPKFTYCLPTFRNPTGETLPFDARRALLEAARETGTLILEDDPYGALRYDGASLPSILSLDADGAESGGAAEPYDGSVIYTGSVSKMLAPALRIGWLAAPKRLVEALGHAKQGLDLFTSSIAQRVALDLLDSGIEETVLNAAIPLYRERRDALLDALDRHLGGRAHWTRPDGGMFVWVTLLGGVTARGLFERAAAAGVGILPGDVFYGVAPADDTFRLSFSSIPAERMDEAIGRLAAALTEMQPNR